MKLQKMQGGGKKRFNCINGIARLIGKGNFDLQRLQMGLIAESVIQAIGRLKYVFRIHI